MATIYLLGKTIIWFLAILGLVVFDFLTSPFDDDDIENYF